MGFLCDFRRTPCKIWINNIVIHKEVGKFTGRDFQAGLYVSLLPKREVGKLCLSKFSCYMAESIFFTIQVLFHEVALSEK